MSTDPHVDGDWLDPWEPADDSDAFLVAELEREVAPGHPLYGVAVQVIGRGKDDDVAFALRGGTQIAAVHLTWARRPETPPWPSTTVYPDFAAFRAGRMQDDHDALFGAKPAAAGPPAVDDVAIRPVVAEALPAAHRRPWLAAASACGVVALACAVALGWQGQEAMAGHAYSIRLVVFAIGVLVFLALLPAASWIEKRGWSGRFTGGRLVAVVAAIGVVAGFVGWAALIRASEGRGPARDAARVQEAIEAHARAIRDGTVPSTPSR